MMRLNDHRHVNDNKHARPVIIASCHLHGEKPRAECRECQAAAEVSAAGTRVVNGRWLRTDG